MLEYRLFPVMFSARDHATTLAHVGAAVVHCLRGLRNLHALDIYHNDIRWPNLMWDADGKCWRIIDFDHATRFGGALPSTHPSRQTTAESLACVRADLLCVAGLIKDAVDVSLGRDDYPRPIPVSDTVQASLTNLIESLPDMASADTAAKHCEAAFEKVRSQ